MVDCMNNPCILCNEEWGNHNKQQARHCRDVLFIYYKTMELISK